MFIANFDLLKAEAAQFPVAFRSRHLAPTQCRQIWISNGRAGPKLNSSPQPLSQAAMETFPSCLLP